MSISKRAARRVEVDGAEYLWTIRPRPTYAQHDEGASMTLAVQASEGHSVLVVDLGVTRPDSCTPPHGTRVTPRMVRAMIRAAREGGWLPESNEGFRLRYPLILDR